MKKTLLLSLTALVFLSNVSAQTVSTNKTAYTVGEAITVNFTGSKVAKDWIALFLQNTTPAQGNNVGSLYINGTQTASSKTKASGSVIFTAGISIAGNYKVCLLANDGYTIRATANFTVATVSAVPIANFSARSTSIITGGTTTFTDLSTGTPTSWSWSFPGGTSSKSTAKNPVVNYSTNGVYAVTLTATNSNGTNTLTKSDYITVAAQGANINLKFLQLNTLRQGTEVPNTDNGTKYIVDIVNAINPDIVCFQEVMNYNGIDWTTIVINQLAALGKTYYRGYVSGLASIISKYPITLQGPQLNRISPFIIDINGTSIVVCSAYLDSQNYASFLPRAYNCGGSGTYSKYSGWTPLNPFTSITDLTTIKNVNLNSDRDEEITTFVNAMKNETRPVFLLGDLNEPSQLDWTAKQANLYEHHGVVYQWDNSVTFKNNGYTDAYRQVYPDEILNPGISWPAYTLETKSPSYFAGQSDDRDRIDFVYYKGTGVFATSAAMVGPVGSYAFSNLVTVNGNDVFEASTLPWPSDHKGLVVTMSIPVASTARTKNIKTESKK